jgi:hypothetical protein
VIIITPGPRYLSQPCCCTAGYCIHLLVPEFGLKMMADLARLHLFIQRRLSSSSNCQVIPTCDLLAGKKGDTPGGGLGGLLYLGNRTRIYRIIH